ncbi:LOW QUALITY PROTEIN: protein ABHD18-like [Liolophura sinensis]|uniref:LOW QUALITY PROTEIN: protein ABHD18-like n=1 Tax=Liolophura sinensis TaxID=3198878 RepID=UPI0031596C02
MSRFDQLYRRILITKFFTKGWGKPDNLKRLFEFRQIISNRESCQTLVSPDYPVHIDKEYVQGSVRTLEGHFVSPFSRCLPGVMPKEVERAKFQVILPKEWKTKLRPVCLHLAGTGDHFFWRRRTLMAKPLLKEAGVASIILENPFYGERKPKHQIRSSLHNVSDLFVMGGALVLESLVLLHWCERQGYGPLAITGVSMGGHMASAAATSWHKPVSLVPCLSWSTASCSFTQMASLAAANWIRPVSLVPCLSWSTASCVFTQGVLSGAIPWDILQLQYFENSVYEKELRQLIHSQKMMHITWDKSLYRVTLQIWDRRPRGKDTAILPQSVFYNKFTLDGSEYHHRGSRSTFLNLPSYTSLLPGQKKTTLRSEALEFMRGVMDEFTHLGNFSRPLDTSLIIIVAAKKDAYIPRDGVLSLEEIWPGRRCGTLTQGTLQRASSNRMSSGENNARLCSTQLQPCFKSMDPIGYHCLGKQYVIHCKDRHKSTTADKDTALDCHEKLWKLSVYPVPLIFDV